MNAGRGGLVDTEALLGPWRRGGSGPSWTSPTPSPFPGTTPSGGLGGWSSPHVAGLSEGFSRRVARFLAEQVGRYLRGEPLLNVVREGY